MLSDQEIVRRLKIIRFSPRAEREARRALSMNAIAKQTGLARDTLYAVSTTGRLAPLTKQRLASFFNVSE
jgi:DNA-binding phage protein